MIMNKQLNIKVYWDEYAQMWAIDIDNKIYTFAFSKKAAERIVKEIEDGK